LGDEAFLRTSTLTGLDGPLGALFVRIGNAVIGLSLGITDVSDDGGLVLPGDGAKQEQILDDLATIVITRLTKPPAESAKTCRLLSVDDVAGLAAGVALTAAEDVDDHDVWGPSCQYKSADDIVQLDLSVNTGSAAQANFEACAVGGEIALGVGDEAVRSRTVCPIKIGFRFYGDPLLVRSGDTIVEVAVNATGELGYNTTPDFAVKVARLTLERLGLDPGATPAPVAVAAVTHPCGLVSDGEVASIVGVTIDTHFERGEAENAGQALCIWTVPNSSIQPLTLTLVHGPEEVREFGNKILYSPEQYTSVPGIGDAAVSEQGQSDTDQPLVTLYVRSGDAVLTLHLGPVRQSDDFLTYVAPGTPAEQLEMLRQLAELILPQLH
jgi:hypothetical protein